MNDTAGERRVVCRRLPPIHRADGGPEHRSRQSSCSRLRLSVDSREDLRRVIEKAFAFLALAGSVVALAMVLFADTIVGFVYPGGSYAPVANALRMLAPALLFIYLNAVFAYSLLGLHYERRLLIMAAAAAVLDPFANLLAIPPSRDRLPSCSSSAPTYG